MAVAQPESALIVTDATSTNLSKLRRANSMVRGYWQAVWHLHRATSSQELTPALADMIGLYRQITTEEERP